MTLRFQSGNDEVFWGMCLKVGNQSCCEFCCPDVIQMLSESGEGGVFCFSNVVFLASCASDYVDQVVGVKGK